MVRLAVVHIGETTLDLQLKFFLMSSQSYSVPPEHQKLSLSVQRQHIVVRMSIIIKYLTVNSAVCRISKAYT